MRRSLKKGQQDGGRGSNGGVGGCGFNVCPGAHIINPINDRCRANFNIYTDRVRVDAVIKEKKREKNIQFYNMYTVYYIYIDINTCV